MGMDGITKGGKQIGREAGYYKWRYGGREGITIEII